jgi:hypothetical protein
MKWCLGRDICVTDVRVALRTGSSGGLRPATAAAKHLALPWPLPEGAAGRPTRLPGMAAARCSPRRVTSSSVWRWRSAAGLAPRLGAASLERRRTHGDGAQTHARRWRAALRGCD